MQDEEIEMVQISINYKGNDYYVTVDMQTASSLLNNQSLAESYIRTVFPEETNTIEEVNMDCSLVLRKVWFSKGKPSKDDDEATILLLQLRQKYADKFNDKKCVKHMLWMKIADEMRKAGFDISATAKEGPGGKVKQKFVNMESRYIKHIEHIKTTGVEKKEPPPFFDELHSILGNKQKVNPENVQDTENEISENSEQPSTSEVPKGSIKNRFSQSNRSSKPKSSSELLLEEMKRQHSIDREDRERQYNELKNLLETQNRQRDRLLDIFSNLVESKNKQNSRDSD